MVRNPCAWPAPMNKIAGTPLGEMADQTVVGSVHTRIMGILPLVTCVVEVFKRVNKGYKAGNHEELLSGMTNNMCEAAMDALFVSIQDNYGSYIAAAGGSRPKPSATRGLKLDPSISKAKFHSLFSENLCEGVYVSIPRKVVETVKIHDVPIQVFSKDILSIIESQIEDVLKESLTISVHLIKDTGFTIKTISTIEYDCKPPRCDLCKSFSHVHDHCLKKVSIPITVVTPVVPAPIVKMTNDGF
nr:hypothetical protein [Tanacetum cinerariifolium]